MGDQEKEAFDEYAERRGLTNCETDKSTAQDAWNAAIEAVLKEADGAYIYFENVDKLYRSY